MGEFLFGKFSHRFNNGFEVRVERKLDNPFFDVVHLSVKGNEGKVPEYLQFVCLAKELFGEISIKEGVTKFLGEDVQKHYQAREAALERMERSNSDTMTKLEEFTLTLTSGYQEKEKELEKRYVAKEKELQGKTDQRLTELEEREQELEKRIKDVNDRESKFERRQTIQELTSQLDSSNEQFKFELTKGTRGMRRPVLIFSLILLTILGGVATFFTYHQMKSPASSEWAWVQPTVLSVGFVAAFAVFVRWLNSWAHQHAQEELRLKRRLLDVRRINLLIETALEWGQESKEEPLPQQILDALSRNIFHDAEGHEEVSPVETLLTALFGVAAGAKIKIGDNEITLDRKSMKTMEKKG